MHQSDIINFLNQPQSYGLDRGQVVKRFDTHISVIFLAGPFAYKLKRAIKLPFVDFRKLEDRAYFCQQELKANQAASAHLYLDVIPVFQNDQGTLSLDGPGTIVEWLVKMHRFDQSQLYDALCSKGELSTHMIVRLVDQIVDCYQEAKTDTDYGGFDGINRAFDGHYKAIDNCPPDVLNNDKVTNLKQRVTSALCQHKGLLQTRQRDGFVRHCHGDLHLRNICQFQDKVTLFDAIEFEPDYALIDIFYDFSFLLMDLCHRGETVLANAALNRYLGRTGDIEALALSGLFLSSRATIRTHVNAVASQNQPDQATRTIWEEESRTYLDEALGYLTHHPVMLIAIAGLSGSGKSTLAQNLAPNLGRLPGAYIARTDMIRKRLMGVAPEERLPQKAYDPEITQKTYSQLYSEMEIALKAGQSVIVDGVFSRSGERRHIENLARKHGVPFKGFWLNAPLELLKDRVRQRENDISDATEEIVEMQSQYDPGQIDWMQIDASQTIEIIYETALKEIKKLSDFTL
ncbi:MAG: AAA family ATPase [Methylocystaceae bacterium]|nr:AAA family ATPase [Methylocystaceae bacterium]